MMEEIEDRDNWIHYLKVIFNAENVHFEGELARLQAIKRKSNRDKNM